MREVNKKGGRSRRFFFLFLFRIQKIKIVNQKAFKTFNKRFSVVERLFCDWKIAFNTSGVCQHVLMLRISSLSQNELNFLIAKASPISGRMNE